MFFAFSSFFATKSRSIFEVNFLHLYLHLCFPERGTARPHNASSIEGPKKPHKQKAPTNHGFWYPPYIGGQ